MKIRHLSSGLITSLLLFCASQVMSEEMTLEQATAEVERLEQENLSLKEQLNTNEVSIEEYKQQMASIEEQIGQLQAQLE